jgi:membrane protease YdiL (CAAX protease family)
LDLAAAGGMMTGTRRGCGPAEEEEQPVHRRWQPLIALAMVVLDLLAAMIVSIPILFGAAAALIAFGDLPPSVEHPLARRVEWQLDEPLDAAARRDLLGSLLGAQAGRGVPAEFAVVDRDGTTVVIGRFAPGDDTVTATGERLQATAAWTTVRSAPLWATRLTADPEDLRWWSETLSWGAVLVFAASSLALAAVALVARRLRRVAPWREPGSPIVWRVAFGLGYGLLAVVVVTGLGLLTALLGVEQAEQAWVLALMESGPRARFSLALVAAVAAPLGEELFFRRHAFRYLSSRASRPIAYLGSALLFGLMHFNPVSLPTYVAYGLVLAWGYERTRSLLVPVIAHSLVNVIALAQLAVFR